MGKLGLFIIGATLLWTGPSLAGTASAPLTLSGIVLPTMDGRFRLKKNLLEIKNAGNDYLFFRITGEGLTLDGLTALAAQESLKIDAARFLKGETVPQISLLAP